MKEKTQIAEKIAQRLEEIEELKEQMKDLKEDLKDLQEQYRIAVANEQSGQKDLDSFGPGTEEESEQESERKKEHAIHSPKSEAKKERKIRLSRSEMIEISPYAAKIACKGAKLEITPETYNFQYTTGSMRGQGGPRNGEDIKSLLMDAKMFFLKPLLESTVTEQQIKAKKRMTVLIEEGLKRYEENSGILESRSEEGE